MMLKILLLVLVLAAPLCADPSKTLRALAKPLAESILEKAPAKKQPVAVMPFENAEGVVTQLGQLAAEAVAKELVASGKMALVERASMDKIFQEWRLAATGAVSPESAQKLGQMTGADYLVVGRLQKAGRSEIVAYAKLVRTETGDLLQSAGASARADEDVLLLLRAADASQETKDDAVVLDKKGPKGIIWVESAGVVRFGDSETKAQARARALVRARQKALATAIGQDAMAFNQFSASAFQSDSGLLSDALLTTRFGRIVEETVAEEGLVDGKDCKACVYRVLIRAAVTPPPKDLDAGFQAELNLNRTEFVEGDEAQAVVNVTRDSYVYLFSVDKDWRAVAALPNALVKDNLVKAGRPFTYPDAGHRKAGIRLVAELPQGAPFSVETLRALATKQPIPEDLLGRKYPELLDALDQAGMAWAESAAAFTIRRK